MSDNLTKELGVTKKMVGDRRISGDYGLNRRGKEEGKIREGNYVSI